MILRVCCWFAMERINDKFSWCCRVEWAMFYQLKLVSWSTAVSIVYCSVHAHHAIQYFEMTIHCQNGEYVPTLCLYLQLTSLVLDGNKITCKCQSHNKKTTKLKFLTELELSPKHRKIENWVTRNSFESRIGIDTSLVKIGVFL